MHKETFTFYVTWRLAFNAAFEYMLTTNHSIATMHDASRCAATDAAMHNDQERFARAHPSPPA